jgi:hypothetical protein
LQAFCECHTLRFLGCRKKKLQEEVKRFTVILTVAGIAVTVILLLSRMTGPKYFTTAVAEVRSEWTNVVVTSPSSHAWFAGLILVVQDGVLSPDDSVEIGIRTNGTLAISLILPGTELLKGNPVTQKSFLIPLEVNENRTVKVGLFGSKQPLEVRVRGKWREGLRVRMYARHIDNRHLKW